MNEELKMPELPAPGCTYADSRYPAFGRKQVERIQREAFEAGVAASDERFWVALVPQSATPSQPVAAEATAEVDPWNDAAALAEMAYLLRLVPRADVVPVQILDVMKRQMAAALKAARLAAPVNVQAGAHAEVTPNGTETNRRAAPDAALSAIHAGVSAMRGQQHKMEGTGQTHTYVVKDDVLGWIENEQRKLAAPVEVQGAPVEAAEDIARSLYACLDNVRKFTPTKASSIWEDQYKATVARVDELCAALSGRPAPAPEAWEPGGIDVTGMTTSAIRPMSCATRPAAPLSEAPPIVTIDGMAEAFQSEFCPYKGSPDPWIVWRAAWQSALKHSAALAAQPEPIAAEPVPMEDIGLLLRDVMNVPGMNSITTPDYAVRVAAWMDGVKWDATPAPEVPADRAALAAEAKQLIGSQVNYPHTPRSQAWCREVFATIDRLAATPAPAAGTVTVTDNERLDFLEEHALDLETVSYGEDDYGWRVVEQYEQEPHRREVGQARALRDAIDNALNLRVPYDGKHRGVDPKEAPSQASEPGRVVVNQCGRLYNVEGALRGALSMAISMLRESCPDDAAMLQQVLDNTAAAPEAYPFRCPRCDAGIGQVCRKDSIVVDCLECGHVWARAAAPEAPGTQDGEAT